MNEIIKDTLHPEKQNDVDIYPKTSLDQVEGYEEDKELLKQEIDNTYAKKTNVENLPLKEGTGKNSIVQKRQRTSGENVTSEAYQQNSVSLGGGTVAGDKNGSPDDYSFAFAANENNEAPARSSSAFGRYNKTYNPGEFVCGNYAEEGNRNPENVLTVGGGTQPDKRHNAFEVRTNHSGGTHFSKAFVGGKQIATEEYVNNNTVHKEGVPYVVYVNEADGKMAVIPYRFQENSIVNPEYTIMFQPMLDGRLFVRYPINEYHAANKGYVDKKTTLYRHEITTTDLQRKLIVINNSNAKITKFTDLINGNYLSMSVKVDNAVTPAVAVNVYYSDNSTITGIQVRYYSDITNTSFGTYLNSNISSDTVTTI